MELRVEDLRKSYGGAAVLQGVSFTAEIGLTRDTIIPVIREKF